MSDDEEYAGLQEVREKRTKVIAWVVIVTLIIVGGGAPVLALIF